MLNIKRKIKVCYVTNTDFSVKFLLLNQLKFLKSEGYEVFVVCSAGKFIENIENQGIKVKIINFKRKIAPIAHLITLFKLFFYFRKEKFDVIHAHTPVPGLLGQLAAKMAGVPITMNTIHGFYFTPDSPPIKRKFFIFIEKIAAFCSNLIFSQNKEDITTAIKEKICSPQKIKYLGNGINLSKFNSERFSQNFIINKKRMLRINLEKKIIGAVGRLVREKGYLELFEAFQRVLRVYPETLLLIIGPQEPEKKDRVDPNIVKNYGIEKNVLFLGQRTDVNELYPLMDIFVLPSWREGFPRTVIEALAMQKAVIATDIRGCRETIDNEINGILVPPKNPEKLAEAIIHLFKNPGKAKKMGQKGREKAMKEFDERLVFDILKKEYQSLILIKKAKI